MSDCPEDQPYLPTYTVAGQPMQRRDDCGMTPQPEEESSSEDSSESSSEEPVRTFTFDQMSVLCADIGLSPEMVEGVIAQLLTQHFSDPRWIIYPELKHLVWSATSSLSKIQILPLNRWEALTDSKLPAIIYSDVGQQPIRLAIGDQYEHTRARPGSRSFARAYTGAHRLMCIGQNDYQASQLATEIDRWISEFAFHVVEKLPFHDFQIRDRQPPQAFSALGDRVGVALTLGYSYIWSWETNPYGAPLKSVAVHFTREG